METKDMPAFPVANPGNETHYSGLTIREYFAGLAMQGRLAAGMQFDADVYERVAQVAVAHADALIAELSK